MDVDDEWDLHAVVRSCTAASAAAAVAVNATTMADYDDIFYDLESLVSGNQSNSFSFSTPGNVSGGLEDVYKAVACGQPPSTAAIAIGIDGESFSHQHYLPMLTDSQSTRPRKRKNQEKRVFQLTQEQLISNDLWAWRKYGQKPIKGSPYPRNYYRCSTTKACGAKKQVERSIMDPNIFIVSYSGEHNHPQPTHRSSLAGTTRSNKFNTASSPASTSSFSPTTSLKEDEYEINDIEYDEGGHIPDIFMHEDVLKKFQNLNGGDNGRF